jgi:hypothetical protein
MGLRACFCLGLVVLLSSIAPPAPAQVIDFDSAGLHYKALTRSGVTIMFAALPARVHDYAILQISVSNGSAISWAVRPEDFRFERTEGESLQAVPAVTVVDTLRDKASRGDLIKLVKTYETGLYGNAQIHSTNGYESRRQSAIADLGSTKIKAAATASAICLVLTKLKPGESTDGAIFFANQGKPLGTGQLIVTTASETFVFPFADPSQSQKSRQ